jgi:hypothetical protein
MAEDIFIAYVYREGHYDKGIRLETVMAVKDFVTEHLFAEELMICDTGDHLLLHVLDGVDLFNALDEIGIDLTVIFQSLRRDTIQGIDEAKPKEAWEILYDQIGLSPGEIAMRQRVKRAAKVAQTVADVADLIRDTYFDAYFYSPDDSTVWMYFDDQDLSVTEFTREEDQENISWEDSGRKVYLSPSARVQHRSSAEDKHVFTMLDLP